MAILLILALCFLGVQPAHGGWLKKLGAAGAAAGAVAAADLAADATTLVVFSVGMAAAADSCAKNGCADQLLFFIEAHPLVGRKLVERSLNKVARQGPKDASAAQMVSVELKAKLQAKAESKAASGTKLDPPGRCTKQRHGELKKKVGQECKGPSRRCKQHDTPDVLVSKLDQNYRCAVARYNIMVECFDGGDQAHIKELNDAMKAVARCEGYILGR